ncbi:hypothetical protein [Cohnella nanjingensis]|uniref:Uncharacterized protein n=1 Tax=Cohnella nanjingensis TaxID=1387779 RepID=A0A7X0VFU9_9BACL|nr:hypothetical protein [Cohnella nanjingensis]MBB6672191.1 hypothetical protein [Cohnella nanjingensis]
MYPQVKTPKKVTEKWLNRAFAPLTDYLDREYPEEAPKMMVYMTFLRNADQRFHYRNSRTKGSIFLDQSGELISCDADALQYEFERHAVVTVQRPPRAERFIHPNVTRWMTQRLSSEQERIYGEEVCIFLQEYWGPMVNFDFEDLKVGYPKRGRSVPYCLYLYPAAFPTLIAMQFVGDEIVEKRCNYAQYRRFEDRERDLMREGWHVITLIREILSEDPDQFRLYLSKAVQLAWLRDPVFELTEAGRRAAMKD